MSDDNTYASDDPSTTGKKPKWMREGRPAPVRCSARRTDGTPCKRFARHGATVCDSHGGKAPQTIAAAKRRLQAMADAAAQRLGGFAFDDGVPDGVALQATNSILDRSGITAKTGVEIEVGVKPAYERVFEGIAPISRNESRRARGMPVPPALPAADNAGVIDAEIVEPDGNLSASHSHAAPSSPPDAGEVPKRPPPWVGEPPPKRPGAELMTMEDAQASLAADRRRGPVRRVGRYAR